MQKFEYRAMYDVEEKHWWFVARRLFLSTILQKIVFKQRKIVDIGSGTGGMIRFLGKYGNVVGIEPNVVGRILAKKRGIILRPGDAEHTKLASKGYDIVCFFDVLYHQGIVDTRALIEAKRILRPGGLLIITDCALPFLDGPHDRAVEGRERYTLSHLVKKVRRAGFGIERKTYMYFLLFPVVVVKRLIDRFVVPSNTMHSDVKPVASWVNVICMVVTSLEAVGLRWFSYPWGSSVCIVARAPGGMK